MGAKRGDPFGYKPMAERFSPGGCYCRPGAARLNEVGRAGEARYSNVRAGTYKGV